MTSSPIRYLPNWSFLLYRRSKVGLALLETLDQLLTEGSFTPDLAYKCVQQLDFCIAVELAKARRDIHTMYRFECLGGVRAYRCVSGLFAFVLRDVEFSRMLHESRSIYRDRRRIKRSRARLVRVEKVEEVTLLTYCPFRTDGDTRSFDATQVNLNGLIYDIKCERDNVNPRLEFYTQTLRKKKIKKKKDENEGEKSFYDRDLPSHDYYLRMIKHRIKTNFPSCMEVKRRSFRDKSKSSYWRTAAMIEREQRMRKASLKVKKGQGYRLKVKGQGHSNVREVAPWKARGGGHLCQVKISRPKKYW